MDIFCKIINGEIPSYKLYEDEQVLVFLDINPNALGHTLIIPKKHYLDIYDINNETLIHIMEIARKIDTYDISILPFEDCCTVFVPKHPVINPREDVCIKEESKFDYSSMIEEAISNIIDINVLENDNSFHDFL